MAKKNKTSTKTKTWKQKYYDRRKYYEKRLKELGKKGFLFYDEKSGKHKSPVALLPEIPKNPKGASIRAMERIYKKRYEKLIFLSESGEIKSGRKYLQEQREKAAIKGAATRLRNKLFEEQRQKDIIEYEKSQEKQEKSFAEIIDEFFI